MAKDEGTSRRRNEVRNWSHRCCRKRLRLDHSQSLHLGAPNQFTLFDESGVRERFANGMVNIAHSPSIKFTAAR
jgi:hypothetical protein